MSNCLDIPRVRRRSRTASENVLGTDLYKERECPPWDLTTPHHHAQLWPETATVDPPQQHAKAKRKRNRRKNRKLKTLANGLEKVVEKAAETASARENVLHPTTWTEETEAGSAEPSPPLQQHHGSRGDECEQAYVTFVDAQLPQCANMTGPTTSMQTFRMSRNDQANLSQLVDQHTRTFHTVEEYVNEYAEDIAKRRTIRKMLVATNGIAAVKCILSVRKLLMQLFKNDHIIKFVSLTTEQEIQSKAEYLKMTDQMVFSPAGANTNNYANVDEIVQHALHAGVDAVWAGWGHASENPRLPEELRRHGIAFIGPPASAMFALGDKIASTIIAQTVQIPTIEWSGSGLVVAADADAAEGSSSAPQELDIAPDLYRKACVSDVEEGLRALREKNITYPVMIKASEGGGGKGIRKCLNDDEFRINFRRVMAEVPGSPIFLMKCLMNARHIEVQLIADQYGQCIPFFTRDCSIQRRCQKIIEEAPAGIAPKRILRQMQQDAVNLAKKVGYVSAGTVEYMYLPETQQYYFLELNPRLQVEHPCTEMVSNVNIPAIQLQIAMGIPLHRIDEIRLFYGLDRYGTGPLPDDQIRTDANICVIAARITSEDPADQFRPASGTVEKLQFQSNQNVWGYFSVAATGKVHEYADSQFGHLFAKGRTRYEAIAALMCALKELELRATFTSQVNYLVGLLHDEEFEQNKFHTGWLDQRIERNVQVVPELPVHVTVAVGATVIGHAKITNAFSNFQSAIERGQILPTSDLTETFELELVHSNVKYSVLVNRFGHINFLVKLNQAEVCTEVRELGHGSLLVTYADQSFTCHLEEEVERYKVNIGRTLTIFEKENDPSVLRSRNAGRLFQYLVKDGAHVTVGETYAEMESMKMVIPLEVKKAGGRLVHVARPGQALFPGTLIARLDDQGDMSAARPREFHAAFEDWVQAEEKRKSCKARLNVRFDQLLQSCKDVLNGYAVPEVLFDERKKLLINELMAVLDDQKLPYTLFKVMLNVVETRINRMATYNTIKELIAKEDAPFPATQLLDEMQNYLSSLNPTDFGMERQYFEALLAICERFEHGLEGHKRLVVVDLLETYLKTESFFQDVSYDRGVSNVKESEPNESQLVVRMVYSHTRIRAKNELLKELILRLDTNMIMSLQPVLKRVANLFSKENEPLALFIRETLNKIHQNRDYSQICTDLSRRSSERSLQELVTRCADTGGAQILADFLSNVSENQLVLHEFFFTHNKQTNSLAVRLFIQNTFYVRNEDIKEVRLHARLHAAVVFQFELSEATPLFEHHAHGKQRSVYFLSVLNELDLLRSDELLSTLKKNMVASARNTFLFVALPRGKNGFSNAAKFAEKDLRRLGKDLRDEVAKKLTQGSVDLMISRAGHPPLYTHYDFSANEKLEFYRLPEDRQDISVVNSPYLLFRHNVGSKISRVFVRYLLRDVKQVVTPEKHSTLKPIDLLQNKLVDVIDGACGELRVQVAANTKKGDRGAPKFDCHHLLIALEYDSRLRSTEGFWKAAVGALRQCEKYLIRNRITDVEITYQDVSGLAATKRSPGSVRVLYANETGAIADVGVYRVVGSELVSCREGFARFAGHNPHAPHKPITKVNVQEKRYQAREQNTTYVYDFPIVIARAVLDLWREYEKSDMNSYQSVFEELPTDLQVAIKNGDYRPCAVGEELVLDAAAEAESAQADAADPPVRVCEPAVAAARAQNGTNERGMLAWLFTVYTPDAPRGKRFVLIANDITLLHGSFSMREHRLYQQAGLFAQRHALPRLFIAANSGARIGYAEDIRKRMHVQYRDESRPEEGVDFLYMKAEDAEPAILAQVEYTRLPDGRIRLDEIVGRENDIGVENLVGSGLIAGESARAYDKTPTYCLVTGRAVGIGAYVARLLRRVTQLENSHLILTGNNALNTLLGRQIYTSNGQLGGPQIMFKNGVSDEVTATDLDGIRAVLSQMSYLTPFMKKDDGEREVVAAPSRGAYDVRRVLDSEEGGLFDRGTFRECMAGWARTIIVGRARVRGVHVGVVATETNTVELEVPADPAATDSQSRTVYQAGQVWYPDSAYKTAEAIRDFHREQLPLIILANIRGFSGGQKDMYEMVLKFGAQIVDALANYTQPVLVYIPPYGELRGGAWAVLDTQINPTCMTMLADPLARGGVLEPAGIVEIKFRQPHIHAQMSRDDATLRALEARLRDPALQGVERAAAAAAVDARRELLWPVYHGAAVKFSDMHDTTARMLAKGAIHDEVRWSEARNYIFQLLRVKLALLRMARRYLHAVHRHPPHDQDIHKLERGVAWTLAHVRERGVAYSRPAAHAHRHRRFDYGAEALLAYEQSAAFADHLQRLAVREAAAQLAHTPMRALVDQLSAAQRAELRALLD